MRYNPHAVIEGMAIAGYAMGANRGYNYVSTVKSGRFTSVSRLRSMRHEQLVSLVKTFWAQDSI